MKKTVFAALSATALLGVGLSPALAASSQQDPLQRTIEVRDQYRMITVEESSVCEYSMYEVGKPDPLLVVHYDSEDQFFAQCQERTAFAEIPTRTTTLASVSPCSAAVSGNAPGGIVVGGAAVTTIADTCPAFGLYPIAAAPLVIAGSTILGVGGLAATALSLGVASAISGDEDQAVSR